MQPLAVKFMIQAADMERAVWFYENILGFYPQSLTPEWSELGHGDAIIGIHAGGDGSPNPTGLSIQYENVGRAYDKCLVAGATGVQEPTSREGEPVVLARIRDPEGNEITLTEHVG